MYVNRTTCVPNLANKRFNVNYIIGPIIESGMALKIVGYCKQISRGSDGIIFVPWMNFVPKWKL